MVHSFKLSQNESDIMELVKRGLANRMISSELDISVNTVKYHLKNLYRKLGVSNRVEAINSYNEMIQIP